MRRDESILLGLGRTRKTTKVEKLQMKMPKTRYGEEEEGEEETRCKKTMLTLTAN
jgi:hypothetical protein